MLRIQHLPFVFFGRNRHEIGQQHRAGICPKPGLENVCVIYIAALGFEGSRGSDSPMTGTRVKQSAEDRSAIEPGPAEPVNGSLARDQSRGPALSDDCVILNPLHGARFNSYSQTLEMTAESSSQRTSRSPVQSEMRTLQISLGNSPTEDNGLC